MTTPWNRNQAQGGRPLPPGRMAPPASRGQAQGSYMDAFLAEQVARQRPSAADAAETARLQGLADAFARAAAPAAPPAARPKPPARGGSITGADAVAANEAARSGSWDNFLAKAPAKAPAAPTGGGSGGGGGVSLNAGVDGIEQARAAAQEAASRLESAYEKDKAELAELYQFSETPEEKARIAQLRENLEVQREEGLAAISAGYDQARQSVLERQTSAQQSAEEESQDILGLYLQASAAAGDDSALNAQDAGTGLGASQGGTTGNDAVAGYLGSVAPSEAALSRRLGDIRAEDIGWLADSLVGESQAQQGDLRRLAMAMIAQQDSDHAAQVADRIFRERMAFADQTGSLQGDYRNREWSLEDQEREMQMRVAEMRAANARAAAASRASGSSGPSLAERRFAWDQEKWRISRQDELAGQQGGPSQQLLDDIAKRQAAQSDPIIEQMILEEEGWHAPLLEPRWAR